MGVEVDALSPHPGLLIGVANGAGAAVSFRVRCCHMMRIVGVAVAYHLGVNFSAAGLCMLIFLQNQHAAAFAHDKAATALVEGDGCAGGIIACVQRHTVAERSYGQRGNGGLCTACHHGVGVAVQNAR